MKKLTAGCLFLGLISLAGAAHRTWAPVTMERYWSQSTNWQEKAAPTASDFAWINNASKPCIVNSVQTVTNFSVGSNATGQLVIADGGILTAAGWCGNGMGSGASRGTVIVETGGVLNCNDHFWTGHDNGDIGTTYLNGGTINVLGQLGLGWDGGTGYMVVNSGTLNLSNWTDQTISSTSVLDISEGAVIARGDQTGRIETLAAAGRITAYDGQGKLAYDYNVTNPGKTTIRATPPIPGDLDRDFDVDLDDLERLVADWLGLNCSSPADLDASCRVDLHDYAVLASNWRSGTNPYWRVADTQFPTDDWIVTPFYARNFGIVADGETDVTEAIQKALIAVNNIGGGTLFLPAGMYKVSGNLTIPSRVTLRGDWQIPDPHGPVTGTVLMAYAGRGQNDDEGTPFIGLSNCAAVKGLTVWYPEQTPDNVQPYPPTIRRIGGSNHSVENITFVNSYIGFSNYSNQITASPFLRNIYGTPLKIGIEFDCLADVGRLETAHFSPDYWKHSGLPGAPANDEHAAWLYNNAAGVVFGRIDWSYAACVTVEGYRQGLLLHPTRNPENQGSTPNGQCYGFDLVDCKYGVYVENNANVGFMFTRFNIEGAETGMYFASASDGQALIHTCRIDASGYAIYNAGSEKIQAISSTFDSGEVRAENGYLAITNCDFNQPAGNHVRLGFLVRGTTLQGNRFGRTARIMDATASSYPVLVDHSPVAAAPLPEYEYRKPARAFTAARAEMYVVTEPPYNAPADHSADATEAFQAALNNAGVNGGGIVFVPGGDYRLDGTLIVPTGVELRGIHDLTFSPSDRGSVLNTYAGKNQESGTPFIRIQPHAGIRGLTIHHAGQVYDFDDPVNFGMTPYPYMIQGLGEDVYVISIAATIPWQILDLATYRCDRHYVDGILGTAMKTGIRVGGGSVGGKVFNCQFNPSAYVFHRSQYASIPGSGDIGGVYDLAWRQAVPYLIGNVRDQVLHQNFVFGGWKGIHFVKENGQGPSGCCLGMGIDQCTTSVRVDDIGDYGFDMINSQIVTVDYENGSYLVTDPALADDFGMFGTCGWGGSEAGVKIHGGRVELQLCQIDSWGWVEDTVYTVGPGAALRTIGSSLSQDVNTFVQLDPAGSFEVIGNTIKISGSGMPVSNGTNLISRGNLKVQ